MKYKQNNRVTIYDIASELGISVGTVNRALSDKPRINPDTKERVLETAQKMGYKINRVAQGLRRNPINIGVILNCSVDKYMNEIKRGMDVAFEELSEYNVFGHITMIGDVSIAEYETRTYEALDLFEREGYDGIIVFLMGNNSVFSKKINKISSSGTVIATVGNDIPDINRVITVNSDGHMAGMLAAEMLYLCSRDKKAAVLTGSMSTKIHRDYVDGFKIFASTHLFNEMRFYEHQDDSRLVQSITRQMLNEYIGLDCIYMTSAIAPVACKTVIECGFDKKLKIITTDLFSETKELMRNGVVCATIFQDPYKQGREVVRRLYRYICDKSCEGQYLIKPQLMLTSNMDIYNDNVIN